MRKFVGLLLCLSLTLPGASLSTQKGLAIKGVRYFSYPTFTRVVLEVESAGPYVLTKDQDGRRLIFTAYEGPLALKAQQMPLINDGVVKTIEGKEDGGKQFIFINLDSAAGEVKDFVLRNPDRVVLDVSKGPAGPPVPASSGRKTVIVMLDPGHGGKDKGLVFAQGQEKSLTLELARAVKRLAAKKESGLSIAFTREKDQSLSLDERAAITNSAGATLYLSIHAGAGKDMRVYVLELDSQHRPGGVSGGRRDFIGFETESEQQQMFWGRQQAVHIQESNSLGRRLIQQMTGRADAEPIQAPLAALGAVDAAAAVVEIGAELDRTKTAEAIVKGIEQYVREKR
jgi:N-acetylmuramoyl-L-alanine amidase